jgi:hypothetical protein
MPELHETMLGRMLIEHTLPEIALQLKRIADELKNNNAEEIRLKERYKTLSELDADPTSTHRLHKKVLDEMHKTLGIITKNNSPV